MTDAAWFVVSLVAFILGYVSGLKSCRDGGPPPSWLPPVGSHDTDPFVTQDSPNYPDSAGYKRGT